MKKSSARAHFLPPISCHRTEGTLASIFRVIKEKTMGLQNFLVLRSRKYGFVKLCYLVVVGWK